MPTTTPTTDRHSRRIGHQRHDASTTTHSRVRIIGVAGMLAVAALVVACSTTATGAADDSASVGGWTTLAIPNASVNLLAYQNGVTLALGQNTLAAGNYLGFRLVIDPTRSSLTLKNGMVLNGTSTPSITLPSASRGGIKMVLVQPVTITANQTTTVLVDFVLLNSFVMRGNSIAQNGLLFKPVVQASVK